MGVLRSQSASAARGVRTPGWRPWKVGTMPRASRWFWCWPTSTVVREAWCSASGIRGSGVATALAVFPPLWEALRACREETLARMLRAAAATSMDVVPFLKASLRLLSVLLCTPVENPRSSDRAVAALRRRALLEDAALESMACGSLEFVRHSSGFLWQSLELPLLTRFLWLDFPC